MSATTELAFVTTVFQPPPSCTASDNIWLKTQDCGIPQPGGDRETKQCSYFQYGNENPTVYWNTFVSTECFPWTTQKATVYTDCPAGYTAAIVETAKGYVDDNVFSHTTRCCPTQFDFTWAYITVPFTSEYDGEQVPLTINSKRLECTATAGVDVLISQTITVRLGSANDNEPTGTTTAEFKEGDILLADAFTVRGPTIYVSESSTCWERCPYTFEPSPTFPENIDKSPVTTPFEAPTSCLDPSNLWRVQTVDGWLDHFGAPVMNSDTDCYNKRWREVSTEVDGTTKWYAGGCPSGYTAVTSTVEPFSDTEQYPLGHFDISTHHGACCPTAYDFKYHTALDQHGMPYPLPFCYATSIKEFSGKEIIMELTHNWAASWEKRDHPLTKNIPQFHKRQMPVGPTGQETRAWDWEADTLHAHAQYYTYQVFEGTHTCYSSLGECSSWQHYYYPEGVGAATTPAGTSSGADPTITEGSGGQTGTGPQGTASTTSTGERAYGVSHGFFAIISLVMLSMIFS